MSSDDFGKGSVKGSRGNSITTLRLIPGSRPLDSTASAKDLYEDVLEVVYKHAGLPLATALGVLALVHHQLIEDVE